MTVGFDDLDGALSRWFGGVIKVIGEGRSADGRRID